MLYFEVAKGNLKTISAEYPGNDVTWSRGGTDGWMDRNDFKTYEIAKTFEGMANLQAGEQRYLATDAGPNVSPRYDVVELPKVGDKVSYAFNGDSYPDGEIVSISKSLKLIKTSTGGAYYRRRLTGSWVKDGTWSLVDGHHYEQNPSF